MHDKFLIVDGETVETGSLNYSAAAESKNAESVVVLHNSAVAERYGQEWMRLWDEAEEMQPRYHMASRKRLGISGSPVSVPIPSPELH